MPRTHRRFLLGILLSGSALAATSTAAQGSPHTSIAFFSARDAGSYAGACAGCHVLSKRGEPVPGAWEGSDASRRYRMYASAGTNAARADQPSPASLVCLTCHDGTVGPLKRAMLVAPMGDLRGTHPISIVHDPLRNPNLASADAVDAAGLPLPEGRVECSSCHDPHGSDRPSLLRTDNAGSALCLICHRA